MYDAPIVSLRVLFVVQRLPPDCHDGAPMQALTLARALASHDVEVEILTTRHVAGQRTGPQEVDGIVVHRLATSLGRWLKPTQLLRSVAHVTKRRSIDVVHGHALTAAALGALVARCPVVLKPSLAGPTGDLAKIRRSPTAPLLLPWLRRADRFAVIDDAIAAELQAIGVPAARIWRTRNGVDTKRFRPPGAGERAAIRASLELGEEPVALYVGQMIARKRIDELLAVWPEVHAASGATLVVAGDGPLRASAPPSVRVLGARDDVPQLLRAADLFVLPSRREGISNACLEALASGLPLVVGEGTLPRDLIDERRTREVGDALAPRIVDALATLRPGPAANLGAYEIHEVARAHAAMYRSL